MIGDYAHPPPACSKQSRDPIRNAFHFRVDMADEGRAQRVAHLVESTNLRPSALIGLCRQSRFQRLQNLDSHPSHLIAQARSVHRLFACGEHGIEIVRRCAALA